MSEMSPTDSNEAGIYNFNPATIQCFWFYGQMTTAIHFPMPSEQEPGNLEGDFQVNRRSAHQLMVTS